MPIKKINMQGNTPQFILRLVGIILIAAVLIVAVLRDRIVNNPQWQVQVTGVGKINYQPDTAKVSVGVQVDRAATAEEALQQLNGKINSVISAVSALNVKREDISTQNYSLYPQYDYVEGISKTAGYTANQQLVITVRDLGKDNANVSQVVSAATKAGANQVNSISFDAANLEKIKQEARFKAIDDAKQKATAMSQKVGVRLGKIVGWWENYPSTGYDYGKGGMGAGGAVVDPNIPSGNPEFTVEINISYQIK